MQKEEKTEYVAMQLPIELAKEVRLLDDNEKAKAEIIRRFVTNETEWLKEEMQNIDEATLLYTAKLVTIKDKFTKAQDLYVEEIEKLMDKTSEAFKPIDQKFDSLKKDVESTLNRIEYASKQVDSLREKISYINYSSLEKLIEAVDKFNSYDESQKELIRLILSNNK